jgi:hypothetical protein
LLGAGSCRVPRSSIESNARMPPASRSAARAGRKRASIAAASAWPCPSAQGLNTRSTPRRSTHLNLRFLSCIISDDLESNICQAQPPRLCLGRPWMRRWRWRCPPWAGAWAALESSAHGGQTRGCRRMDCWRRRKLPGPAVAPPGHRVGNLIRKQRLFIISCSSCKR